MNITINTRRDMLVLNMVLYLLIERDSDDTKINPNLIELSNKSHKANKKINELSQWFLDNIKRTIDTIHIEASNRIVLTQWCDKFWEGKEVGRLFHSIIETNLEFLAQQILYVNFIDKKHAVHKHMEWLLDENKHNEWFSLLEQTNAEDILGTICDDAYRCVAILKG